MSHHPERTARNVRPVNQPPCFHNARDTALVAQGANVLIALMEKVIGNGNWQRER